MLETRKKTLKNKQKFTEQELFRNIQELAEQLESSFELVSKGV